MPEGLSPDPGPDFLKDRYWGKEEFRDASEKSADKAKRLSPDLEISPKPQEQISHYLERIERVTCREDPMTGERGRLFLEKSVYPRYIVKPDNISDEYIKGILLGNFAERLGYGPNDLQNEDLRNQILKRFAQETGQEFSGYKIPEEEREKITTMVTSDQRSRLNEWFDYLTSAEARNVPSAFRYWAFAEMLKLGSFDDDRKYFNKRTETTAASFPELNQQALALVFDEINRHRTGEPSALVAEDKENQTKFREYLQSENFGKLYAFMLEHVNSLRLPEERLAITQGEWRHFPRGTDARELTQTLQGFNTKWCIAGEGYAQNYLSHSDLWVYYSEDIDSQNTIPRACIVHSKENGITEVRGILSSKDAKQHLDSYITPIVEEKLKNLPGGEQWQGAMKDMRQLARIHLKYLQNDPLEKEDLVFLYEMDKQIQSTGYQRDPRIEEIKSKRNPMEDAPIVLDCQPEEIAWGQDQINQNTKAYIGHLFTGIFNLPNLEQIFLSFPEGKIRKSSLEIGGKTEQELEEELEKSGHKISEYARSMMRNPDFRVSSNPETLNLVRLKVADLGFPNSATTQEIYDQAEKYGLELCPPEVGPYQRLKDAEQPMGDWYIIAMNPFADSDGNPDVFLLERNSGGSWLSNNWRNPGLRWSPDHEFMFRFSKVSQET